MANALKNYLTSQKIPFKRGVFHLSPTGPFEKGEEAYLKLRDSEGRIYSDEALRKLPEVEKDHPLSGEWGIRSNSLDRVMAYLTRKQGPLTLLDIGCGNGWMSRCFAERLQAEVLGLDTNMLELKQGARVFKEVPGLCFAYGDIFEADTLEDSFDIVTLAGSVQYFPNVTLLLSRLVRFLKSHGELHIFDSPFYSKGERSAAKERSIQHFQKAGFPEMAAHYHHHLYTSLAPFSPISLYDPKSLSNRIARKLFNPNLSPFRWIVIEKP